MWDPQENVFKYHVSPYTGNNDDEQNILPYIVKIFDPLGFLSLTIFQLKWYLQQLWLLKEHWDTVLLHKLFELWRSLVSGIEYLSHIKISRFLGSGDNITIIGCCDTS